MSSDRVRSCSTWSDRRWQARLLFAVCFAAALVQSLPAGASEPRAKHKHGESEHDSKDPFGHVPKGPLQIIISIDQQKLHLYSDGTHVVDSLVATGVSAHPTPAGVFSIIQKSRYHRSNIYSNAPMPFMQRITWSGVALHEGVGAGHRASHGCIRMPREFATQLWTLTKLGARVIIADAELHPEEIADPHLFMHETTPTPSASPAPDAETAAPAVTPKALQAAQTADAAKTATDAAAGDGKDPAPLPAARTAAADPPAPAAVVPPRADDPSTIEPANAPPADAVPPIPEPLPKPAEAAHSASKAPITVFVSRKDKKIYVRQDFAPLFDTPISIAQPQQPLGTHVFTALDYAADHASFRWNVISLPGEPAKEPKLRERERADHGKSKRRDEQTAKAARDPGPPQTPQQALARIDIPKEVIEQIAQLIVPGSSLIISDQGLGEETGEGTDFIVVTR